jgi:hypothetical protein
MHCPLIRYSLMMLQNRKVGRRKIPVGVGVDEGAQAIVVEVEGGVVAEEEGFKFSPLHIYSKGVL